MPVCITHASGPWCVVGSVEWGRRSMYNEMAMAEACVIVANPNQARARNEGTSLFGRGMWLATRGDVMTH